MLEYIQSFLFLLVCVNLCKRSTLEIGYRRWTLHYLILWKLSFLAKIFYWKREVVFVQLRCVQMLMCFFLCFSSPASFASAGSHWGHEQQAILHGQFSDSPHHQTSSPCPGHHPEPGRHHKGPGIQGEGREKRRQNKVVGEWVREMGCSSERNR